MQLFHRDSKKHKTIIYITFVFAIIIILFFSNNQYISNIFYQYIFNVQNIIYSEIRAKKNFYEIKKGYELARTKLLEQEINYDQIHNLIKENQELKKNLDIKKNHLVNYNLILAEVIARSADNYFDSIKINKGKEKGIKKNNPVITYYNNQICLVGNIFNVEKRYSTIKTIYNKDCEIGITLENDLSSGITKGVAWNKLEIVIEYLDYKVDIPNNTKVFTLGENSIYPKGILIGNISTIYKNSYGIFQKADFKPAFNIYNLKYVFILCL